jgi:hypothetical protein
VLVSVIWLVVVQPLEPVTVHFNTGELPAVTVTLVVLRVLLVIVVPAPLTRLHAPVPGVGELAAIVNAVLPHWLRLLPALAPGVLVSVTPAVVLHVPPTPVTVHTRLVLVPWVTPVTVLLFKVLLVIVPLPLMMLQAPLPTVGAVPLSVKVVVLHWLIVPAATAAGDALVKVTCELALQVPLVTVHLSTD